MPHRRKNTLVLLTASAFFTPLFYACADSATAPEEVLRPHVYITDPYNTQLCRTVEPAPYTPDYYDPYGYPQQPVNCIQYQPPVYPVVVDRPLYSDVQSVGAVVDTRNEASIETLVWYEQQQGYQSLRAYLDPNEWTESSAAANGDTQNATGSEGTAQANDGVTRADFAVGDGILSLLNNRGELQVGDSVYKLTRDNAYAVHVNDLALLRQLVPTLSSPAPGYDPRIVSQPVETTSTPVVDEPATSVTAAPGGPSRSLGFVTDNCTWRVGDRRMHGKSYITNALFYSEAGVKTEWERKKWFWWSNTWQAGTLEYAYTTGSLRKGQSDYVTPTSGSGFATGTSGITKVIATAWFRQIRGTINGTHTSSVGQCYTRVSRS
jgi:hypothetical protein